MSGGDLQPLLKKKMWAGDRLFLDALETRSDFSALKLRYEGETLVLPSAMRSESRSRSSTSTR